MSFSRIYYSVHDPRTGVELSDPLPYTSVRLRCWILRNIAGVEGQIRFHHSELIH